MKTKTWLIVITVVAFSCALIVIPALAFHFLMSGSTSEAPNIELIDESKKRIRDEERIDEIINEVFDNNSPIMFAFFANPNLEGVQYFSDHNNRDFNYSEITFDLIELDVVNMIKSYKLAVYQEDISLPTSINFRAQDMEDQDIMQKVYSGDSIIEYNYGKYALEHKLSTTYDPEYYTPIYYDFFKANLEVYEYTDKTGNDFYTISAGRDDIFINTLLIDSETYLVRQYASYEGKVSKENRKYAYNVTVKNSDVEKEIASQAFARPNTEIRTAPVQAQSSDIAEATSFKEAMINNKLMLFLPAGFEPLGYQYAPTTVNSTSAILDRDFYPTGEIGDLMYSNVMYENSWRKEPQFQNIVNYGGYKPTSADTEEISFDVNVYPISLKDQKPWWKYEESDVVGSKTITINGKKYNAAFESNYYEDSETSFRLYIEYYIIEDGEFLYDIEQFITQPKLNSYSNFTTDFTSYDLENFIIKSDD